MIGKFICGLFGLMIAGPFGLIIGVIIGHFFDKGLAQHLKGGFAFQNNSEAQQTFFKTTFQVMGYIAKADGVVTNAELDRARELMQRLNLNETQKKLAIDAFNEGKQAEFNLDQALDELLRKCHHQRLLLQLFIEFQTRAATIDGHLDSIKESIITHICQRLGFITASQFNFQDFFRGFEQFSQQQHQRQAGSQRASMSIERAYQVLEITSTSNDQEVKKAYRKLIGQNHPDKLVSKGLPPEMIKLATEKTQRIQAAYEQICAARGLS